MPTLSCKYRREASRQFRFLFPHVQHLNLRLRLRLHCVLRSLCVANCVSLRLRYYEASANSVANPANPRLCESSLRLYSVLRSSRRPRSSLAKFSLSHLSSPCEAKGGQPSRRLIENAPRLRAPDTNLPHLLPSASSVRVSATTGLDLQEALGLIYLLL